MKFGTAAVHAGVEPDPSTGAIMDSHLSNQYIRTKSTRRPQRV